MDGGLPVTPAPKVDRRVRGLSWAAGVALVLAVAWFGWSAWRSAGLRSQARDATGRGRWALAEDRLARLAWYRPRDPEVANLRYRIALGRGDVAAAAGWLDLVPDSAPEAAGVRLTQGRLWLESFQPRRAEAAFRAAMKLDPASDASRLALIAILAVQHRARDYEAAAWGLYEHGEVPIKALRLLAQAGPAIPADTLAKTADEGTVLRKAVEVDPDDAYSRIALARFERGRGQVDEALRLLEPLRLDPSARPEARIEWAACRLDEGEDRLLDPFFKEPPGPLEEHAPYWLLRGEWDARAGRPADALACFREAVRRDPRDPAARYRLGRALRSAGFEAEAASSMELARKAEELKGLVARISDHSDDAELLGQAGRLCATLGRDREARAWLDLASKASPPKPPDR